MYKNDLKPSGFCVRYHLLKLRALVRTSGVRPVNVLRNYLNTVPGSEIRYSPLLCVDTLLTLVIRRESGV